MKTYRHFNVQFHMLPEELLGFVEKMSAKYSLNLRLERHFPKRTFDVAAGDGLEDAVQRFGYPDVIWLVMDGFQPGPGVEYMMLGMGNRRDRILTESHFGGRTKDDDAYQIWRAVFTELKLRAPSGGWVVNPTEKVKGFSKRCHFSPAAAEASRRGEIVLKDVLGAQAPNYMVPDEPELR